MKKYIDIRIFIVEWLLACFIIILLSVCKNKEYMKYVQFDSGKEKAKYALFAFLILLITYTTSVAIGFLMQMIFPALWIHVVSLVVFLTLGIVHIQRALSQSKSELKSNNFLYLEEGMEWTQPLIPHDRYETIFREEEFYKTEDQDWLFSLKEIFRNEMIYILVIIFAIEWANLIQITTIILAAYLGI